MMIDNDAKMRVALFSQPDQNGALFYIGKLQFPGNLKFQKGISFMVFTSEPGFEEIQIGPVIEKPQDKEHSLPPRKRSSQVSDNQLIVDLYPKIGRNDSVYYIGEVKAPINIETDDGIFFTVFTSRSDEEKIQIGFLDHERKRRGSEYPGARSFSPQPQNYFNK